jgi:hypothetical protein
MRFTVSESRVSLLGGTSVMKLDCGDVVQPCGLYLQRGEFY